MNLLTSDIVVLLGRGMILLLTGGIVVSLFNGFRRVHESHRKEEHAGKSYGRAA